MPEAAQVTANCVAPWIRKEAVSAERSPEVVARREKAEASALAREMRDQAQRRGRGPLNFYCSDRARSREPLA
jgi:hypothetical protein